MPIYVILSYSMRAAPLNLHRNLYQRMRGDMDVLMIGTAVGAVSIVLVVAVGSLLLKDRIAPVEVRGYEGDRESEPEDQSN
jgi:hypothetical protein